MKDKMVGWEQHLFSQAYYGLEQQTIGRTVEIAAQLWKKVYEHCREITAFHSRTFYLASGLLGHEKRAAVRALYAFCRISDDIVDEGRTTIQIKRQQLARWRKMTLSDEAVPSELVALAWLDTRQRYQIPLVYAEQLLDGIEKDLTINRYADFADLAQYCYGVASTVGLMAMHIIGYSGPEAVPYAVRLGVALQLTNILRDIGEDWEEGRLYLPLDELAAFSLTEADIAAGVVDDRWRAFMKFQIERIRQLYRDAQPGIQMLGRDGRFAIAAAAGLYEQILDDIEAHDYDVFSRRAHRTGWQKLTALPKIWWETYL